MSERPLLFMGSASEGLDVARNLEAELDSMGVCHVERWDRDVFEASGYTLDSLAAVISRVDFAVLIATPDDVVESRGESNRSPRDNVLLELGMCFGAIGRERTYLLATDNLKLPSDVLGLTRLAYSPPVGGNLQRALNRAALQVEKQVKALGRRPVVAAASEQGPASDRDVLARELELLCGNARAQGWTVKSNSDTTLRLLNPQGQRFTMQKGTTSQTRAALRTFAAQLRSAGLRVNSAVRKPVELSPL